MEPTSTPIAQSAPTTIVASNGTVTVTSGGRHADSPAGAPPELLSSSSSGTAAHTTITLTFNTAMAAGSGTIYVTDGAVQTVIDRATGMPTMRIVGATDTHQIAAGSVQVDGAQVTIDATGLLAGHTYSVVMDAGVLVSESHRVFGGLRSASSVVLSTPAGDTQPPTLASIALDGAALSVGHDIGVTLTFSEAVTLPAAAIGAPNAAVGNLHTTDGGRTWVATLSGAANTTSLANTLAVDMGQVRDAAGNAGSGTSTATVSYKVDTVAPTVSAAVLDAAMLKAGGTIGVTITFSEPVPTLDPAALRAEHATVSDLATTDGGLTWHATLHAPATPTSAPGNTLAIDMSMVRDANGNPGTGLATLAAYAVDTTPPAASVTLSGAQLSTTQTIDATILFAEAVTGLTAASFSAPHSTVSNVATTDGGRTWHATLTGTGDTVALTAASALTLDMSTVRDAAGNAGAGTVSSQGGGYYVDTRAPGAVSVELGGSSLRPGGTMEVTITFSEPISELNAAAIVAPHASVGNLIHVSGNTWRATLTGTDTAPSSGNQVSIDMSLVRDPFGNSGSGIVRSASSYAVDADAPTVASISLDGALITSTHGISATIRFSEAVPGLTAAAIGAPNASVSNLHTTDGGLTWVATLSGAANTTSPANTLAVDMGQVRDAAGNAGSGTSTATASYKVDTVAPTVSAAVLDAAMLKAGGTIGVTITFSEPVATLDPAALRAEHATVSDLATTDGGLTWHATLHAPATPTSVAGNTLAIDMSMVRDANGNPGTGLATLAGYAVDTAAPTASVGLSISLLSTIHTIDATIVFDEAVTGLTAASFSAPHATVSNVSAIDGGRVWHATLTGTADTVELTAASVLTLDMSTVRDAAGNAGAGTVTSQDYYVDTRAPAAVSVELGGSSLSPGGTMEVTITVSEPITELNAAAIVAPHASVGNVVHVGGNIWRATLTGTDSTPSSGNQVSVDMSLVRDLLGNSGSGIVRSASSYAIDTGAPTVASIALDGSLINTNQAIGLTIRFSEAVPGLTAAAIIAPHAVVSGLHTTDNITWYAYLAGIADTTATGAIVGVDLSKVHDAAGNVGSGITHATQGYEVDTSRPTVVGAIELDGSVLGIEDYVVATIRFSEKVYVNADAISAPHARVYAVYPADASLSVWQVLLIAADNGTNAPSNELTIDLSKVSDLSGNAGSGTFGSGNYAVDTIPRIEFNDSGWIDNDAVTNDASAYLSGSFVDRGSEPLKVKVKVDGTVVPDGDVTVYHSSELGYAGWNTSVNLADGPHHVEVWFEDAGGRQIALGSQDITVDTTGPSITAPLETGPALNVAAPLEIRFNEAVYWDYDADGDHFGTVNVYNEDTHAYTQVYVDDRNLSADRKTLTIAADDLHLTGGGHYRVTLPYSMADVAGNWLGENEIAFQTSGTYTDDTAPTALRAEAGTNSGWWGDSYPAGTVIDITILFSEPVRVVDGQSPVLRLNTGGVATYYNTSGDGREVNFKYTVAAGDADTARLAIVDSSGLVNAIADLAGHKLDAAHIDYSALEPSMTGYGSDIISVDTHAPGAITDLALDPYSDRGDLDNDLITNDTRPTLYGTGAEPNAMELRIYEGSELVGYGYAHSDGSWWADVNSDDALADGIHHLSVTQVDQAGNESPHSAALAITIDTIGPASAPGAPVLAAASDTGTLNDGITADNTPTFNGTGAEPNRVVKLFANEHFVGQAVSNASGAWSITVTDPLADRTYSFGAQQFDLAGNKSAYSDSVTVTIAAGAPATSSVSSLATASDSRVLADSHIGSASTGIDLAAMFMTGELPQAHAYWEIGDSFAGRAALIGVPDLALSIAPLG